MGQRDGELIGGGRKLHVVVVHNGLFSVCVCVCVCVCVS